MEHVEGEAIDAYCTARRLGTRERLEMFRTVCLSVHYAHQNLVVHRDLKPQNILVTADGQPKLLDFGIAKLLSAGLDPDEAPTATLLPMMTPEYASPEQVRGEVVTTASDVYSLGVVLYELLTGSLPYRVRTGSLEEIVRVVCGTEPALPSAAAPHGRDLVGDLDTIVLKALRKEPARRYLSAQEMAEDLRRYLEGLPVLARKDTVRYRLGKFVRRHWRAATAAGLLVASLLGGMAATMRQAGIAEAQRRRAEKRFADVRKLANTLLFDVHDDIRDLPGATHARQRLVDTAKTYLASLSGDAQDDPLLRRELAAAYERLGDIQGRSVNLRFEDSLACYRQALGMRETLFSARGRLPEDAEAWVRLEFRIGQTLRAMHRLPDAEQSFRVAAGRLQSFESRTKRDLRTQIGGVLVQLSETEVRLDRDEEARKSIEKALAYLEAFGRDHPDDAQAHSELALAYYVDGEARGQRGDALGALARARQSRALLEELVRREPLKSLFVRRLLFALHAEARHLESLGRMAEALEAHRHCLAVAETVWQQDSQDRFAHLAVAAALSALGRALVVAGQPGVALEPLRSGRRIAQEALAMDSSAGNARNELAVIDSGLAAALARLPRTGDGQEGCRALADAQGEFAKLTAEGPLIAESRLALRSLEPLKSRCPPSSSR
jgi:tetratricopeptide (TPR) repeat protein